MWLILHGSDRCLSGPGSEHAHVYLLLFARFRTPSQVHVT